MLPLHSAETCKRGEPLVFINIHSVAKYQKTRNLLRHKKNCGKKSHSAETN